MKCLSPLWKSARTGRFYRNKIVQYVSGRPFVEDDVRQLNGSYKLERLFDLTPFRCRKCMTCKEAWSMQWRVRVALEQKEHNESCFITLTYDDSCLSWNDDFTHTVLDYRDFQLFMKRLRKRLGIPIRYMVAGGFGEKKGKRAVVGNPHWHIVLLGWCPKDLTPISKSNQETYSPELMKVWTYGFNTVSELTSASIGYVASYSTSGHHFHKYSLRPALGANYINANLEKDEFYYNGRKSSIEYHKRRIKATDYDRAERLAKESQEYSKEQFERNIQVYGSYCNYLEAEASAAQERYIKRQSKKSGKNWL